MLKGASHTNWEFEGFKVLTEVRLLLSHGTPVPLTSKAFDTLVLLIANRDRVVTKVVGGVSACGDGRYQDVKSCVFVTKRFR